MIRVALVAVPQAAEIINTGAKDKLTEKNHVVTGNLRRSGHVSRDVSEVHGVAGSSEVTVRAVISFPPIYALKIEQLPDGGYLYEATEENAARCKNFIARSMANGLKAFR